MERPIRRDEERAVQFAIQARIERARKQFEDQNAPQLLERLSEYHSTVWHDRVLWAAYAICGDPRCRYEPQTLDADAYYYLQRFG